MAHQARLTSGASLVPDISSRPHPGLVSAGGAGRTLRDGEVVTFTGKTSIEVRTGSSGATQFTLNGQLLGPLGKRGVIETWLFEPPAAPVQTQRQ